MQTCKLLQWEGRIFKWVAGIWLGTGIKVPVIAAIGDLPYTCHDRPPYTGIHPLPTGITIAPGESVLAFKNKNAKSHEWHDSYDKGLFICGAFQDIFVTT